MFASNKVFTLEGWLLNALCTLGAVVQLEVTSVENGEPTTYAAVEKAAAVVNVGAALLKSACDSLVPAETAPAGATALPLRNENSPKEAVALALAVTVPERPF